VIVMKFGHSTEENWERVTIFPDTHIFQTTAFVYAGEVEDAFFMPNKINISDIQRSKKGRRLSVEGIVIEKSSIIGTNWVRTDVLLSSRQDDTERIWLKLWRSSAELLKDVVIGQVIICYAVRTTIFNGEVELMNTDETSIEIHTTEEQSNSTQYQ